MQYRYHLVAVCLVAVSTVLTNAISDGYYYEVPGVRAPLLLRTNRNHPIVPTPVHSQYHTQDGFGQYAYGYTEPLSAKQEVRSLDGTTRGSYAYVDAAGKLQTVTYTADADGFRVAATNLPKQQVQVPLQLAQPQQEQQSIAALGVLPQPVQDTPAVAAARAEHLAAHQRAKLRLYAAPVKATEAPQQYSLSLPQPVQDTPEVAAAKTEFFKRFEEVKQRNERLRQQQQQQHFTKSLVALVNSQPITVSLPLSGYQTTILPSTGAGAGYQYGVPTPAVVASRTYLPLV